MSDEPANGEHWGAYMCTIDGKPASVLYSESFAEVATGAGTSLPSQLVRIVVEISQADEQGMPVGEELDILDVIEKAIEKAFASSGRYVGRITSDGEREFFVYSDLAPHQLVRLTEPIEAVHGYTLAFEVQADPKHRFYRAALYPSPETRQWMLDADLFEQLSQHGDLLTEPRRIEHYAYFDGDMGPFVEWVREAGFEIESIDEDDSGVSRVHLWHIAVPDRETYSSITIELMKAAIGSGGRYDGWETSVVRRLDAAPKPADGQA